MRIQVNGEPHEVPERLSLAELLGRLQFRQDSVAVERNLEIVPRNRWTDTLLQAGDRLEIVHFVGGG